MTVSTLGILFFIQSFPKYLNMLIIGGLNLLIAIIAILIMQMKMPELKTFSMRMKIRIIIILALITLIIFIPTSDFVELGLIKSKQLIQP